MVETNRFLQRHAVEESDAGTDVQPIVAFGGDIIAKLVQPLGADDPVRQQGLKVALEGILAAFCWAILFW